jgi:hypothetical protein
MPKMEDNIKMTLKKSVVNLRSRSVWLRAGSSDDFL